MNAYKEDDFKPKEISDRNVVKPFTLKYKTPTKEKIKWSILLNWFIIGFYIQMFIVNVNTPEVFIEKSFYVFVFIIISQFLRIREEQ